MSGYDKKARRQIDELLEVSKRVIGQSMKAAYLFGSAAAGGLKKDSDIDILIMCKRELKAFEKRQLIEAYMKISGEIGNPENKRYMEITIVDQSDISPWQYPPRQELLYGEWLRQDFEAGEVPEKEENTDLVIVLKQLLDNHYILYGDKPEVFIPEIPDTDVKKAIGDTLPELMENYAGDERNTLLTLCRMIVTLKTGEIIPKQHAAERVQNSLPEKHQELLQCAISGYLDEYDDRGSYKGEDMKSLVDYLVSALGKLLIEGNQLQNGD